MTSSQFCASDSKRDRDYTVKAASNRCIPKLVGAALGAGAEVVPEFATGAHVGRGDCAVMAFFKSLNEGWFGATLPDEKIERRLFFLA